jgi:hypothetical protein
MCVQIYDGRIHSGQSITQEMTIRRFVTTTQNDGEDSGSKQFCNSFAKTFLVALYIPRAFNHFQRTGTLEQCNVILS